jgi:hypothetical protein
MCVYLMLKGGGMREGGGGAGVTLNQCCGWQDPD